MKKFLVLLFCIALCGCSGSPFAPPTVSLGKAMIGVIHDLANAQKEVEKSTLHGLIICDVTVTIGVTTTESGNLGVSAASAPILAVGTQGSKQNNSTVVTDYKSQKCIDMTAHQPVAPKATPKPSDEE